MTIALLPAKPLEVAKTRLEPLLSAADRMAVARAMFEDVVAALTAARGVDRVLVVTADAELATLARARGAFVVDEHEPRGLNGAVAIGTEAAIALGATAVLVVLSDVPLVRASDVEELLTRTPRHGGLVVPSKEGLGTNAMVRRPASIYGPCFGGRSFARHLAAAERAGVPCAVWRSTRLGFDVDTPEDLRLFAGEESRTATYREATRLGLVPLASTA